MCIITDKIKFCTCVDKDIDLETLDHYWISHEFHSSDHKLIVGLLLPPTSFFDKNFELNQETILNRLNEKDAFDAPIQFKKRDRLEICLKLKKGESRFSYNYIFGGRKWMPIQEDPFILQCNYKEKSKGVVRDHNKL